MKSKSIVIASILSLSALSAFAVSPEDGCIPKGPLCGAAWENMKTSTVKTVKVAEVKNKAPSPEDGCIPRGPICGAAWENSKQKK